MSGHGSKRGRKQEAAIAALLSCSSLRATAQSAGISAITLQRWLKIPEFAKAFREARLNVSAQAEGRLPAMMSDALSVLKEILLDPKAPPSSRISVASIILNRGVQINHLDDLDARLAEIERRAEASGLA